MRNEFLAIHQERKERESIELRLYRDIKICFSYIIAEKMNSLSVRHVHLYSN